MNENNLHTREDLEKERDLLLSELKDIGVYDEEANKGMLSLWLITIWTQIPTIKPIDLKILNPEALF